MEAEKRKYPSQVVKSAQSKRVKRMQRCKKLKLLKSIQKLRKSNLEKLKKMEETVNKIESVKKLRDQIYEHINEHSGRIAKKLDSQLTKRKNANKKQKFKTETMRQKYVTIAYSKVQDWFRLVRLNPIFPNMDVLQSFKVEKIEAPLEFDFIDDSVKSRSV